MLPYTLCANHSHTHIAYITMHNLPCVNLCVHKLSDSTHLKNTLSWQTWRSNILDRDVDKKNGTDQQNKTPKTPWCPLSIVPWMQIGLYYIVNGPVNWDFNLEGFWHIGYKKNLITTNYVLPMPDKIHISLHMKEEHAWSFIFREHIKNQKSSGQSVIDNRW